MASNQWLSFIQLKCNYKEKVKQEQTSLIKIPDSFKKIIVVGDNSPIWRNEDGITIIGIYDFLLNENSLEL